MHLGILPDLAGHLFRLAHLAAQREFNNQVNDARVTSLQYGAMELIRENPGIGHKELANALATSKTVLTTSLKPVLAAALVERATDTRDSRTACYFLTPEGVRHSDDMRAEIAEVDRRLLAGLSAEESDALKQILRKLTGYAR